MFATVQRAVRAAATEAIAAGRLVSMGLPDVILHFLGGLGDELLLTCVARELRRRQPNIRIWQIGAAAELLRGNPDYHTVLGPRDWRLRHSSLLRAWRLHLSYATELIPGQMDAPPDEHLLARLCRQAGLTGTVALRPWCWVSTRQVESSRPTSCAYVAVQSVAPNSYAGWMANKLWSHDRMQCVVTRIRSRFRTLKVVQVGSTLDLRLDGALDLRGRTSLMQLAGVLSGALAFVGTSGFLKHLARAVNTRSTIIYGGRERAWQSGYPCNENLESSVPCAPCWLWHRCDSNRICMEEITSAMVLDALERCIARMNHDLETGRTFLRDNRECGRGLTK